MARGLMAHGAAGSWATLRPLETGSHTAAHEGPHRLWVASPGARPPLRQRDQATRLRLHRAV